MSSTAAWRSMINGVESVSDRPRALASWAVSLVGHAVAGLALIVVAPRLAPPPESNVFTWHVALVSQSSSEVQAAPRSPEAAATRAAVAQAPGQPTLRSRHQAMSPSEQVSQGSIHALPPEAVPSARRQVVAEPIRQAEMPRLPIGPSREIQAEESSVPTDAVEPPQPSTKPPDDQRFAALQETAPAMPHASRPEPVPEAGPSSTTQTPGSTTTTISEAMPVESAVNEPAPLATTPSSGSEPDGGAEPTSPVAAETPRAATGAPNPVGTHQVGESGGELTAPRRDYGWLVSTLRQRIVGLKRYPLEARTNRIQGRVVVRAVISDTGDLLDATIAQTSGFDILDRDALDLVRKSCPVALRESILQSQVVLKVPVSYSLTN